MPDNQPDKNPEENPENNIRKDMNSGGPLSEAMGHSDEVNQVRGILKLVEDGVVSTGSRSRTMGQLIRETKLLLATDIMVKKEDKVKFEDLLNIYSYFKDKVEDVNTYGDMLAYLEIGMANPEVISMWLEEEMITVDPSAVMAIAKGDYKLTGRAHLILAEESQRIERLTLLLDTALQVENATEPDAIMKELRTKLLPESTLLQEEKDIATEVFRKVQVNIEAVSPIDIEEYRNLMASWATEYPEEIGPKSEEYQKYSAQRLREDMLSFYDRGGVFYGAFVDKALVGIVRVNESRPIDYNKAKPETWQTTIVQGLYVTPELRGSGIERELLDQALSHVEEEGLSQKAMALIGGSSERLRKLFQNEGFYSKGICTFKHNNASFDMLTLDLS